MNKEVAIAADFMDSLTQGKRDGTRLTLRCAVNQPNRTRLLGNMDAGMVLRQVFPQDPLKGGKESYQEYGLQVIGSALKIVQTTSYGSDDTLPLPVQYHILQRFLRGKIFALNTHQALDVGVAQSALTRSRARVTYVSLFQSA